MPALTDDDIASVVGAFWSPDTDIFRVLLRATQDELGGDLAEIGVLFGRSAILLGSYAGPDDVFTVVDLFEKVAGDSDNARENEESYPGLTQSAFERNYLKFHSDLPTVVRGLSHTIADHAPRGTHRFVHIDASHLYEHVTRDIEVTRTLLKPDGVVVLDDFRAEHTPGVAAACWQAVVTSSLRPFAVSPFKLYATWGDASPWMAALTDWARRSNRDLATQMVNGRPLLRVPADPPIERHPAYQFVPQIMWPAVRRVRRATRHLRR